MSHDGTIHSGTTVETPPRNIVDLYFRNTNSTASPYDLWQVGDALLNKIEEVEEAGDVTATELSEFETVTNEEFRTVEQRMTDVEEVMAQMIFELNDIGINFTNKINEFRDRYLNT